MPRHRSLLPLIAAPLLAWAGLAVSDAAAMQPAPDRQAALVRMVRQDCGSCHGMRLTGGLGPALTPQALAGKPQQSLAATIVHGRAGTAMPGWRALLLDDTEALWIAQQLLTGFPEEARRHAP